MKRVFPVLLTSGILATALASQNNVLIVIADDLGVDHVGAYGEGPAPAPTPNIDALAARGVLFRNAWSNPNCSPTRACFHTGRYSLRTFVGTIVTNGGGELQSGEITLPRALNMGGSGYSRALIGKWHLGGEGGAGSSSPNHAGWPHFVGLIGGSSNYFFWARTENGQTTSSTTYITTQLVDDALAWIAEQKNQPWVCCVSFTAPHTPFHAPPSNLHTQNLAGKRPETEPVPFFRAMVEAMDNEIGRLFSSLGPSLNQTDVIFFGDNGTHPSASLPPFAPGHSKGTPYEGGINVPLIVAGPRVRSPGREEESLVGIVDLFATVLELAGVEASTVVPPWVPLDSVSAVPYLDQANHPPLRKTVFTERFLGANWSFVNRTGHAAIRDHRYKLIRDFGVIPASDEFYDLEADPFEQQDLLLGPLSGLEQQHHDALEGELSQLRSPSGALHDLGTPMCAGSNGRPSIGGTGVPSVGRGYSVRLRNAPPTAMATLFVGASTKQWLSNSLPLNLASIGGGPGCLLYTSGEIGMPVTTTSSGEASVSVVIPLLQPLVSKTVFHSWLVLDPTAPGNALGVTTSNGMAAVIGT